MFYVSFKRKILIEIKFIISTNVKIVVITSKTLLKELKAPL
jgi:hypothetical protein